MTKEDIKKAFVICCGAQDCTGCPILDMGKRNEHGCKFNLFMSVFDIVAEQEKEIERLKAETSNIRKDTAKEILQTLYDKCYEINDETGEGMGNFVSDDDILCLAKHYGVEVDV